MYIYIYISHITKSRRSRRAVVSREAKKKQYARAFQAYATTTVIKTSGSESRGQEEAVCTRISGLRDHYSELFARMVGLNF